MTFPGKMCLLVADLLVVVDWKWVLLIKRRYWGEPDKLYMPGGYMDADNRNCTLLPVHQRTPPDPSVKHVPVREAEEEVHLVVSVDDVKGWCWLDKIGRDPRELIDGQNRLISRCMIVHCTREQVAKCYPNSEVLEILYPEIDSLRKEHMGFDHWEAVEKLQKERQRRIDFWQEVGDGCYDHNCEELQTINDSSGEIGLMVSYANEQAKMDLGVDWVNIKVCPFCGYECHLPIKE